MADFRGQHLRKSAQLLLIEAWNVTNFGSLPTGTSPIAEDPRENAENTHGSANAPAPLLSPAATLSARVELAEGPVVFSSIEGAERGGRCRSRT